jgi:YbgC/YbaW family acyl-CoA thioester hydrolase
MKQNIIKRRIMWGDLDSLGIVFYPRFYEWFDGCGHLFFESIGLPMNQLWQSKNLLFGLVETSSRYFSPGRYNDRIRIVSGIEDLTPKTVTLIHRVERTSDGTRLVEGLEKRICMDVSDPHNFQARQIPPDIFEILQNARD